MPMTYEEKLREEFTDRFGAVTVCGESRNTEIANFFVKNHIEFVESVRKEIKSIGAGPNLKPEDDSEYEKGYWGCRTDILSLPSLTVSNK